MIAPGASSSPCSASAAIDAGTPTLGPSQKGGTSQAGDERHSNLTDGTRHQGSAFYHAVLRCRRIPKALHQSGGDDPRRSSALQSP
jgi:hypothetical protein